MKKGRSEKDKYNAVKEMANAARLGSELSPEDAKLVFDSDA